MIFSKEQLRKLMIPLIIEQVLSITVGMADTIMVSSVGEAAISGVSLVDMINGLLLAVFAALATGGAVVTAQYIGARKIDKACESAKQLLIIAFVISVGIMAICLVVNRGLLRMLFGSIDNSVMKDASLYFYISSLSFPFMALYNAGAALFRVMGNSKISMKVSLLMNVVNIAGNALCIYGLNMGVEGAAIPTLISRGVAALVILKLILNKRNQVHIRDFRMFPDFIMIKKILHIGVPSGVENGLFQLGRVLVVSIIARFDNIQIAANAVANSVDAMGCIAGQAMSLAMITVIGQCVGAQDEKQVRYYTKKIMKLTYIITLVANSCILLSLPWILQIFNLQVETSELSFILIMIHNGFAMLLWPSSFTLPNALRACNDVKFVMYISIFSMCTFRVVFSYIMGLGFGMGAIGVWIAMIIDWVFRVGCFVWRFASGRWRKYAGFV